MQTSKPSSLHIQTEHALLLCCARTQILPHQQAQLGRLLEDGLDWERLIPLGRRHGLLPLLYWHIKALPPETVEKTAPASTLTELRDHFHGNSMRYLTLGAELLKVLHRLESENIPAIPLKGVAMATQLYGNPALRQPGDLDILIRAEHALAGMEVIEELGYKPRFQSTMSSRQKQAYVRFYPEMPLYNTDVHLDLDLHWRLFPQRIGTPTDFAALWKRRETVEIRGGTAPVLGVADSLAFLCLHGSKHRWTCLKWLCDVAELLRVTPDLDWKLVRSQARHRTRMLWIGLALAHELLDTPLPAAVRQQITADLAIQLGVEDTRTQLLDLSLSSDWPFVEGLVQVFAQGTARSSTTEDGKGRAVRYRCHVEKLILQLSEQHNGEWWGMAKNWLRFVTQPTLTEICLVSLPAPLFPLYRLLRLTRLFWKVVIGVCGVVWGRLTAAGKRHTPPRPPNSGGRRAD